MALKVKILQENNKVVANGTLDGSLQFRFEDLGDRWSVRIGKTWQYKERERYSAGHPKLAEARNKIYCAIARFRNEVKPMVA